MAKERIAKTASGASFLVPSTIFCTPYRCTASASLSPPPTTGTPWMLPPCLRGSSSMKHAARPSGPAIHAQYAEWRALAGVAAGGGGRDRRHVARRHPLVEAHPVGPVVRERHERAAQNRPGHPSFTHQIPPQEPDAAGPARFATVR